MIKIGLRNNLLYRLFLIIFTFFRRILFVVISDLLKFKSSISFLTLLMFFSEFIVGLSIYMYQLKFFKHNKKTNAKKSSIKLIVTHNEISYPDSLFKIYILIFIATYFDFVVFILTSYYFPQFENISISLNVRLGGALTLSSFILSYFLLKIKIFKHQKVSLIIIFVCLLLIIIVEISFNIIYHTINGNIFHIILLSIICFFFLGFQNNIEKYLLEYNYINPFLLLMLEGSIGLILSIIFSLLDNPFKSIIGFYSISENIEFIYLLICLILFIILSGLRNSYKILTIRKYSPMTKAIADSFLDPLLILYYFFVNFDFMLNKERNTLYFILNLILLFISVFSGCVYSELLVIYHFNLEKDTHYEVSRRATEVENFYEDVEMISSNL